MAAIALLVVRWSVTDGIGQNRVRACVVPRQRFSRRRLRRRRTSVGKPSKIEEAFALQVRIHGLPEPEREVRFAPPRLFRLDFAWRPQMVALECEGGTWMNGRHSRGKGFESDCEKYALAVLAGWRVLRATTDQIEDGIAIEWVKKALAGNLPLHTSSSIEGKNVMSCDQMALPNPAGT